MPRIKTLIFLLIACICAISSYSQEDAFRSYQIEGVGHILIPQGLEVQSGKYRRYAEDATYKKTGVRFDYTLSDNKTVFQQEGLNAIEKSSFASYVRLLIETEIGNAGDFEKLNNKISLSASELAEVSREFKNQLSQSFVSSGYGMKLIKWLGVSLVTINNVPALKISYTRQLNDKPVVLVNIYQFQNNDRMHSITFSYRKEDEGKWKMAFQKAIESFRITNIR